MEILIKRPRIESLGDRTRVCSDIIHNDIAHAVWFEVSSEYADYLVSDRSDAFLVGMLNWAMRNGCDIRCEAPVSEEILYKIRNYLVPTLAKHGKHMRHSSILAECATSEIANVGAVGTGMSCGVDSLHSLVANGSDAQYRSHRVTHLTLFNVGAYREDSDQLKWQLGKAGEIARKCGLKLVVTNSNLSEEFPRDHHLQHTFSNAFGILSLAKLWGTYFYGSSGMDFSAFSVLNNDENDAAFYDLLSLQCFSTRKLQILSEGATLTKFQKVEELIDSPIAQEFLHVCVADGGPNCNTCGKCRRQLVMLDALNALDKFSGVFDIGYYRAHRQWYFRWMVWQRIVGGRDALVDEAFERLRKDIHLKTWIEALALYPVKFVMDWVGGRVHE